MVKDKMEEIKIILNDNEYIETQKDNKTILTTFNKKTKRKINLIFNNSIVTDNDKLGDKLASILTN
jgi:hypothetical protein